MTKSHDTVGIAAPVVDLESLWGTASVWPVAVRTQVAHWAQSDEPLDRAAAVGLAVRGGGPLSTQPADLLAYLRRGPGGWSAAWAAALEPEHARALARRTLWCIDALAEWVDLAANDDDVPVPVDWPRIVEERERLACVATALVSRAGGPLRWALDGLDAYVLLGRWGEAPPATVPEWMGDVANAQGVDVWWHSRR